MIAVGSGFIPNGRKTAVPRAKFGAWKGVRDLECVLDSRALN